MPEDIIDFHPLDGRDDRQPDPVAPNSPERPNAAEGPYVTRQELTAFGDALAQQLASAIQQAQAPAKAERVDPPAGSADWERQFTDRAAEAATQRLLEIQKPLYAAQIADYVATDFGPEVREEILRELKDLPGAVVASIAQSPNDLRKLVRMARGIHAERGGAIAPVSKGTGTVAGATVAENDDADRLHQAYRDIGVTREMAKAWARNSGR